MGGRRVQPSAPCTGPGATKRRAPLPLLPTPQPRRQQWPLSGTLSVKPACEAGGGRHLISTPPALFSGSLGLNRGEPSPPHHKNLLPAPLSRAGPGNGLASMLAGAFSADRMVPGNGDHRTAADHLDRAEAGPVRTDAVPACTHTHPIPSTIPPPKMEGGGGRYPGHPATQSISITVAPLDSGLGSLMANLGICSSVRR